MKFDQTVKALLLALNTGDRMALLLLADWAEENGEEEFATIYRDIHNSDKKPLKTISQKEKSLGACMWIEAHEKMPAWLSIHCLDNFQRLAWGAEKTTGNVKSRIYPHWLVAYLDLAFAMIQNESARENAKEMIDSAYLLVRQEDTI